MEDMIKRIIELDKQAQESLVRANQMKIDSEQRISDMKEKKRKEYMEKASTPSKLSLSRRRKRLRFS